MGAADVPGDDRFFRARRCALPASRLAALDDLRNGIMVSDAIRRRFCTPPDCKCEFCRYGERGGGRMEERRENSNVAQHGTELNGSGEVTRREYSTPRLVEYGSFAKLTQGG